ncbi:MAG: hypothetical protein F4X41_00415 [Chloroflexi bacterium]|nr:hypothetical protein [Chloroflexota bacterium]
MVAETLAKLDPAVAANECRYVGMGSIFFRDFQIFHRRLGMNDMVTIEGNRNAESRVKFNLPLACIELMMDSAGAALAKLQLGARPHVIWLDYESRLNPGVLSDVEEAAKRSCAGSILLVSVNAERLLGDERESWLSGFGAEGERPHPRNPRSRREYTMLSYRLLDAAIQSAIRFRNAALPSERRIEFRQLLHLVHADGAQMLTVGGALAGERECASWPEHEINTLEFTRSGKDPFHVRIPPLTRREAQHLLSRVPDVGGALNRAAAEAGIPRADARQFASIYRYAPLFVEAEDW